MFVAFELIGRERRTLLTNAEQAVVIHSSEFEPAAGGGGTVVAARSKFDPAVEDTEIEPMDEAAIATLLTKGPVGLGRCRSTTTSATGARAVLPSTAPLFQHGRGHRLVFEQHSRRKLTLR
jgi:hypothetical protein